MDHDRKIEEEELADMHAPKDNWDRLLSDHDPSQQIINWESTVCYQDNQEEDYDLSSEGLKGG